jgi:hypothetical protein
MVLRWSTSKIVFSDPDLGSKILKIDHLKIIHAMFALNWLTGFRGEGF